MAKLFHIKMEEMSEDILEMGLMEQAKFQENEDSGLNASISVGNQRDDTYDRGVNIKEDQDIKVLDLIQEKLPVTDVIVTVHE